MDRMDRVKKSSAWAVVDPAARFEKDLAAERKTRSDAVRLDLKPDDRQGVDGRGSSGDLAGDEGVDSQESFEDANRSADRCRVSKG